MASKKAKALPPKHDETKKPRVLPGDMDPETGVKYLVPDEVIDPVQLAIELTCEVGASARYSFRRSVRDDTAEIRQVTARYAEHIEEWPALVREIFANLYDPDELTPLREGRESPFARAALHALEQQPQFPTLRAAACSHRIIAAESGAKISLVISEALGLDNLDPDDLSQKDPRDYADKAEVMREMMEEAGASEEQIQEVLDELEKKATAAQSQRGAMLANLEQAMKSRTMGAAMDKIAAQAQKRAESASVLRGCGLGSGISETGDEGIDQELLDMLEGNPYLLEVLKQCGRLREAAAASGLKQVVTGNCDVVGISPDDDVMRLIPEELALLDDEDLGDYTLARLLDKEALCWELESEEYRDRGDIILMVDKSGSMQGGSIIMARALAAASMINAVNQGRRVTLCMFGSSETLAKVDGSKRGLKDAIKALGLPASDWSTMVAQAMETIHREGFEDMRDPDVMIITDGAFPNDDELQKQVGRFPDGTRFNGLILDGGWGIGAWGGEHDDWMTNKWGVRASEVPDPSSNETVLEIFQTVGAKNAKKKGGGDARRAGEGGVSVAQRT